MRNKNRKTKLGSSGFTLIEIVLALSVISLIIIVAYNALTSVVRAKQTLDDQRDATMIANSVLSRLVREFQLTTGEDRLLPPADNLTQLYNQNVHLIGEQKRLSDGRFGDKITFVANEAGQYAPDGLTHTGMVQITYRVEEAPPEETRNLDEKTYYLVRDEVPLITPPEEAYKKIMTFPVTKKLISLRFSYFDERNEEWVNVWDKEKKRLPRIIHFNLKIASPRGQIHTYTTSVPIGKKSYL